MKYYIGIDLGGTNIVAGVVNEAYEILAKASVKTNLPRPEQEIAADARLCIGPTWDVASATAISILNTSAT